MNPNDNDQKPTLTPDPQFTPTPEQNAAGDDAAMKAIEALESESNALDQAEEVASPAEPSSDTTSQTNERALTQEPTSDEAPSVKPEVAASSEPAAETPVEPESTGSPLTDKLEAEPAADSAATAFQPFASQKKRSKKPLIILVVVLVVLGLGVGGYFAWQYFQPASDAPIVEQDTGADEEETADDTTTDPASIVTAIDEIENDLGGLDDSEYADATLSDGTLYE